MPCTKRPGFLDTKGVVSTASRSANAASHPENARAVSPYVGVQSSIVDTRRRRTGSASYDRRSKPLRLRLARHPVWTTWVGGLIVRAIAAWQRLERTRRRLRTRQRVRACRQQVVGFVLPCIYLVPLYLLSIVYYPSNPPRAPRRSGVCRCSIGDRTWYGSAERLARTMQLPNARFIHIDIIDVDWSKSDAFYFYNPFAGVTSRSTTGRCEFQALEGDVCSDPIGLPPAASHGRATRRAKSDLPSRKIPPRDTEARTRRPPRACVWPPSPADNDLAGVHANDARPPSCARFLQRVSKSVANGRRRRPRVRGALIGAAVLTPQVVLPWPLAS